MRLPRGLAIIVVAAAMAGSAAACGGSSSAPSTGVTASSTGTGEEQPAGAPPPAAGGAVEAVSIADGVYSGGSAHVEVSGGKQLTVDAPLVPAASMTTEGTTLLMYAAGEGENTSVFSISNGADTGLAFTVTGQGVFTGGDSSSGCAIELTKNDASGLEGRFACRGLQTVGLDVATIDVSATFSATR